MVVHLTTAAHKEALGYIASAVAAAARELALLKQMNMLPLHLTVADKIECCGESRKSRTDDVCGLLVHILRLFGMYKRFIGSG